MIIDCHGHYTTEPKDLLRWRKEQVENVKEAAKQPAKASLKVSDDEIRESLEGAQLKLQRERGTDVTIFSPRAMGMSHHIGDYNVSLTWSQLCNEMIHRVCTLYPDNFIGVCQLPSIASARSIPTISSVYANCRSRRACRPTAASASSSAA
jgi:4-oxalmesaconate hydratase